MPCRCDGYEVSATEVRAELTKQIEHLEGQLCNARSLLHKILKETINIDPNSFDEVPVRHLISNELVARADQHIALLLQHKREEHAKDVQAAKDKLQAIQDTRSWHERDSQEKINQIKQLERKRELAQRRDEEESKRLQKLVDSNPPSDEELLG